MTEVELRPHPATFSKPILDKIISVMPSLAPPGTLAGPPVVLDMFAGSGKIHVLQAHGYHTIGVELEPEWAGHHPDTIVGDATKLSAIWLERRLPPPAVVCSSPCYGNRFADTYTGDQDTCLGCAGRGELHDAEGVSIGACPTCEGSGKSPSRRHNYTVSLGRTPTEGSAAVMQWGRPYRDFHRAVYRQVRAVMGDTGWLVINMSDHVRDKELAPVTLWHATTLAELGFRFHTAYPIGTQRQGEGANRDARAQVEWLMIFRWERRQDAD